MNEPTPNPPQPRVSAARLNEILANVDLIPENRRDSWYNAALDLRDARAEIDRLQPLLADAIRNLNSFTHAVMNAEAEDDGDVRLLSLGDRYDAWPRKAAAEIRRLRAAPPPDAALRAALQEIRGFDDTWAHRGHEPSEVGHECRMCWIMKTVDRALAAVASPAPLATECVPLYLKRHRERLLTELVDIDAEITAELAHAQTKSESGSDNDAASGETARESEDARPVAIQVSGTAAQAATLPSSAPDAPADFCSQCGQSFLAPACGPTHVMIQAQVAAAPEQPDRIRVAERTVIEAARTWARSECDGGCYDDHSATCSVQKALNKLSDTVRALDDVRASQEKP